MLLNRPGGRRNVVGKVLPMSLEQTVTYVPGTYRHGANSLTVAALDQD